MITYKQLTDLLYAVQEQTWETPVTEKFTDPANPWDRGVKWLFEKPYLWVTDARGRLTLQSAYRDQGRAHRAVMKAVK